MKVAKYGVLVALSLILSYVESLIPIPVPIPGIKLGLANLVTIIAFYLEGRKCGWIVSLTRICLSALLFGNLYSFAFSVAGGILSLIVMTVLLSSEKFSMTAISCAGGVAHNIGQIIAAAVMMKAGLVLLHIPYLMIGGIISGIIIGIIGSMIIGRIKKAGVKGYENEN